MECPYCQTENIDGSANCDGCGQDLTADGVAVKSGGKLQKTVLGNLGDVVLNECLVVPPSATVADAVKLMRENRHGSVQIVEDGVLVGIFTESDLLRRLDPRMNLDSVAVTSVMTSDPETYRRRQSIADALNGMSDRGYRHLPIVEGNGAPQGIVSVRGLLAHIRGRVGI